MLKDKDKKKYIYIIKKSNGKNMRKLGLTC